MKFQRLTEDNKPRPYTDILVISDEGMIYAAERSKNQVLQHDKTYDFYQIRGPYHNMLSNQIIAWCYMKDINIEIH